MLQPKRTKFRRQFRLNHDKSPKRNTTVAFGEFGLQSVTSAWITDRQIESARIAITRKMGREGKVWIKIFPHMPKTSKPIGVRMGSGKGNPDKWMAVVRRETVMFEVAGVPEDIAKEALRLAMHKLPVIAKVVKKGEEIAATRAKMALAQKKFEDKKAAVVKETKAVKVKPSVEKKVEVVSNVG